jgi:hypothetical protein
MLLLRCAPYEQEIFLLRPYWAPEFILPHFLGCALLAWGCFHDAPSRRMLAHLVHLDQDATRRVRCSR